MSLYATPQHVPPRAARELLRKLSPQAHQELHHIVELACLVTSQPMAAVTVTDMRTQFFISSQGLDGLAELPMENSFCHSTALSGKAHEIADLRKHPVHAQHPMVAGAPHLASYTGVPLTSRQGEMVGTICVLGHSPKNLSATQRKCLDLLAELAMAEIDLHMQAYDTSAALKPLPKLVWPERILLISAQDSVQQRLQNLVGGAALEWAPNTYKACAWFERALHPPEQAFGLVVVDIDSTGLPGPELLARLDGLAPDCPKLIVAQDPAALVSLGPSAWPKLALSASRAQWLTALAGLLP